MTIDRIRICEANVEALIDQVPLISRLGTLSKHHITLKHIYFAASTEARLGGSWDQIWSYIKIMLLQAMAQEPEWGEGYNPLAKTVGNLRLNSICQNFLSLNRE